MMNSVIQFEGTIYENGYGLLAQKVMRDKDLPKQSKLIYAYMCSFAGVSKDGERTAFPSVSLQCTELGMSEDTYYKWRKPLIDKGYIKIEKQRKEGAKFDNNIYSIVAVPFEVKKDEEEKPKTRENEPHPKKSGMEPYPKNPSTVNPSTENSGTNSNSFNSNILKKEEEEDIITLDKVTTFLNQQINKREITNPKTLTAIYEVAAKCKAIGKPDREGMENYCITVIEEKMSKFGQKQSKPRKSKPIRTELLPDWFDENKENAPEQEKTPEEITKQEVKNRELDRMLKKLRS